MNDKMKVASYLRLNGPTAAEALVARFKVSSQLLFGEWFTREPGRKIGLSSVGWAELERDGALGVTREVPR